MPNAGRSRLLWILSLFVALTIVATWPQFVRFDSVPDNVDAYFSLWRLGWIAHQLPVDPQHLFDGNIFYPETRTLAYSDAILLEGLVGLPFIRTGIPVVYVYNTLVLGSFVAAALSMFLLARRLTGETAAAVLAGLVFAFAPYRFDHYYHLELLWAMWMPLAFWMAHRTLENGRLRDGLGMGACIVLQTLSSIYYGIFLCTALIVFVLMLPVASAPALRRRAFMAFGAGMVLAAIVILPYMLPYRHVRDVMGERNGGEALLFGAGPRHYLATMPENLLEGPWLGRLGRPEKRLFPGFVALGLGLVAVWPPISRRRLAYAVVTAMAIDLSFGPRGLGFDWLRDHVMVYRGLRAPARFGQVALLGFAVLAAEGCARLRVWLASRGYPANAIVAGLIVAASLEFVREPLKLTQVPTSAPPAYAWVQEQPYGVVAEFPTPTKFTMPFHEGEFQFLSIFHWRPLVNGYSGNWTLRQVRFMARLAGFPDDDAIRALREHGVRYVLIHERYYGRQQYRAVIDRLGARTDIVPRGRFEDGGFEIAAYQFP